MACLNDRGGKGSQHPELEMESSKFDLRLPPAYASSSRGSRWRKQKEAKSFSN